MWAPSGAPTDALDAFGADLPRAQDKPKTPGAQDLSIPAQGVSDHPPQSGLVHRHQLHPDAPRISLSGGHHGLAQPEGAELAISNSMDVRFCIETLKEALARYGPPEIFNSDQGSQFTSTDFTDVLCDAKVKISMDGRGRWIDNRMIERFWRSLKYECVYLNAFETGSEARNGIGAWISYYNEKRPHSSHGLLTPTEAYDT